MNWSLSFHRIYSRIFKYYSVTIILSNDMMYTDKFRRIMPSWYFHVYIISSNLSKTDVIYNLSYCINLTCKFLHVLMLFSLSVTFSLVHKKNKILLFLYMEYNCGLSPNKTVTCVDKRNWSIINCYYKTPTLAFKVSFNEPINMKLK